MISVFLPTINYIYRLIETQDWDSLVQSNTNESFEVVWFVEEISCFDAPFNFVIPPNSYLQNLDFIEVSIDLDDIEYRFDLDLWDKHGQTDLTLTITILNKPLENGLLPFYIENFHVL
jgi:hypothetical protein